MQLKHQCLICNQMTENNIKKPQSDLTIAKNVMALVGRSEKPN